MKKLILAASGAIPADLVLKNAQILNVFTGEWQTGDIAVCGETIAGIGTYSGNTEIDLQGRFVVPGFINTHIHIESTMVTPAQLAAEIVPWGTTTIIADPHEIANVRGLAGILFMLQNSRNLLCDMYFMLPSCVPALPSEDSGAVLNADELVSLIDADGVLGLGEVMNFPAVVAAEESILKKLCAFSARMIDGHAPNLSGKALQAYCASGIASDHECSTVEETLEKLRAGMYILARQGSSAKNTESILRAIQNAGFSFDRVAFCTDDKHIFDIRKRGDIAENIKIALALGISPAAAYTIASLNGARMYGLRTIGALAPSYQADMVVLDDLTNVRIHSVYKRGIKVSQGTAPLTCAPVTIPEHLLQSVLCKPITEKDLHIPCTAEQNQTIIQLIENQILTKKIITPVPVHEGFFAPDADSRYQKIVAIERHKKSGKIGLGIVSGFAIRGAIAATVSHDSHNIVVIGSTDSDIVLAVNQLVTQQGGFVCAQNGRILGTLALPVCGLMTNAPTSTVLEELAALTKIAYDMGIPKTHDPFITLSFLALPVIPEIRITTHGLVTC